MDILLIGTSHKQTTLALREKINPDLLYKNISKNFYPKHISEFIIVSTCNRIEIYVVGENTEEIQEKIKKLFHTNSVYIYKNHAAIRHLFAVASGIDSMVLGESEILAQIKEAYMDAIKKQTTGPVLHQLCKDALHIGKHIRNETTIGSGITSVAHAAVLLAKKHNKNIKEKKVLVIGAGIMGQRIIKNLKQYGVSHITVMNRSHQKAKTIAEKLDIQIEKSDNLVQALTCADLVFSATSAPAVVITKQIVEKVLKKRNGKPLSLIDLAVPRDIDPKVADNEQISLSTIDAIQTFVEKNIAVRTNAVTEAETIIANETKKFWRWYLARQTIPLIIAFNHRAETIKNAELTRTFNKLSHLNLNERDKNTIATLSHRVADKLLTTPMKKIKQPIQNRDKQLYIDVLKEIFDLEV